MQIDVGKLNRQLFSGARIEIRVLLLKPLQLLNLGLVHLELIARLRKQVVQGFDLAFEVELLDFLLVLEFLHLVDKFFVRLDRFLIFFFQLTDFSLPCVDPQFKSIDLVGVCMQLDDAFLIRVV